MTTQVQLKSVNKIYGEDKEVRFHALKDINLTIYPGEFVAIVGASGSGKSTLMNILGLLDKPTSGSYLLNGENVARIAEDKLAGIRNKKIGFVFQNFNLLSRTSALDNISLPLVYSGVNKVERQQRAKRALGQVGLGEKLNSHPNQLSGGQQQRVAIARSLITNPEIILADEPTGNLDSKTSLEITKLFKELNKNGHTIILITHEEDIAKNAKRIIKISDGRIVK